MLETPSWGYGDSGTRFATFRQPWQATGRFRAFAGRSRGPPPDRHRARGRAPFRRITPTIWCALRTHVRFTRLRIGAVNSTFRSIPHRAGDRRRPPRRACEKAVEHSSKCAEIAATWIDSATVWFADGTEDAGQDERDRTPAPYGLDPFARVYESLPARAGRCPSSRSRRTGVLRDRPRRLGIVYCWSARSSATAGERFC